MNLYSAQISGTEQSSRSVYPNFESIPGMTLQVDVEAGDQLLVTLTAPDTWNSTAGNGSWFAVTSNGENVAQGLYTAAAESQHIPISLQAVVRVSTSGTYEFVAKFCCWGPGGSVHVGAWSPTVLTVLRVQ